jgi:hypothetical protein
MIRIKNPLPPQHLPAARVHGADHADIAQRVQQAGAVVAARAVEEGGVAVREPEELVVVVGVADLVEEDGVGGLGEQGEEGEEGGG